jgi:putative NIF3 family GTP cyclohydrolase 1 type 2
MPTLRVIAERLDAVLKTRETPDYPTAVNGIQLENRGDIRSVAVAVDCSRKTIDGAIASGANLLIVHHGLLWGGVQPIRGALYERLYRLLASDVALYSSHLPLDAHPEVGNNVLLAGELGLVAASRAFRVSRSESAARVRYRLRRSWRGPMHSRGGTAAARWRRSSIHRERRGAGGSARGAELPLTRCVRRSPSGSTR